MNPLRSFHAGNLLTAILILVPLATTAKSQIVIPFPLIVPTPAYSYNYGQPADTSWGYRGPFYPPLYGPYGGGTNRPGWTNYRSPDTSWGYRTYRPRAPQVGITGPHIYGNPNPRSLYRY